MLYNLDADQIGKKYFVKTHRLYPDTGFFVRSRGPIKTRVFGSETTSHHKNLEQRSLYKPYLEKDIFIKTPTLMLISYRIFFNNFPGY
jgi:hypothetical protein